jgi:hypothetical protein
MGRADQSSRGVVPSVLCVIVCDHESSIVRGLGPLGASCHWGGGGIMYLRTF